ncbi:MAG: thioesterase family protein [Verrucomicrobiota bacterium JB023]|nr:thioesterase family protein [Verrucomicrobiota bacterium JB023]
MRQRRTVAFSETDASGRAHFTSILKWAEDAEHHQLRQMGLAVHDGTVAWPRVRVECDYFKPVQAGDEVEIEIEIAKKGRSSLTWAFSVEHEGARIATGKIVTVYLEEGQSAALPFD